MNPLVSKKQLLRFLPYLDRAALLLGIVLFTALVLQNMGTSAYFDEGYSAYLARFHPFAIAGYTALDVHPPLYYAVLHYWQGLFGTDVFHLRLLSLIFAWIAILFGWLIVRKWFGRGAAAASMLLIAISPLFIRYGSAMRMYTMALAIAFAATYVLLHAVGKGGKRLWGVYAVLIAAGLWTNYFTALIWVTHFLWLTFEHRSTGRVMKSWRNAFLAALILYLPWLPWLVMRYGDIQTNGFWIKPVSIDTLTSTVTMTTMFRNSANTISWLAVGIVVLVVGLAIAGRSAYRQLTTEQRYVFRLILALSTLPILLLFIGSLPPLRSSYVYRYILVSSASSVFLIAIILVFAKFRRHDVIKRSILTVFTVALFACGAAHAVDVGNRNLDVDSQNKLAEAVGYVEKSGHKAMIVSRSPYSYYTVRLYPSNGYDIKFVYSTGLAKIGSTKPLYDHREEAVVDFNGIDKVWLIGENEGSVEPPREGNWTAKDSHSEYDDLNGRLVAKAVYYERVQ